MELRAEMARLQEQLSRQNQDQLSALHDRYQHDYQQLVRATRNEGDQQARAVAQEAVQLAASAAAAVQQQQVTPAIDVDARSALENLVADQAKAQSELARAQAELGRRLDGMAEALARANASGLGPEAHEAFQQQRVEHG